MIEVHPSYRLQQSPGVPMGVQASYPMGQTEKYYSRLFLYEANYEPVCAYQAIPRKLFLGSRSYPKRCRFCCRTEPKATFKKEAHVIPLSMGNSRLLSNYECDDCNDAFGRSFENDFATYFHPYRTLARLKGRSGLTTMKSETEGWRIAAHDEGVHVTVDRLSSNPIVVHDLENKRLVFKVKRAPYIPYEVYKCFLRIAITALPETEMEFFEEHLQWLTFDPKSQLLIEPALVWETFFNGPLTFSSPGVLIWRRILESRNIPYMFCLIRVANSMFQFFLPSSIKDANWKECRSRFPLVPAHPIVGQYGVNVERLDLSQTEKIFDHAEFPFSYQEYSKKIDIKER